MADPLDPSQLPDILVRWANGQLTLKEIKGYSDDELYAIAHTGYFFLMQGKNQEARTIFEGLVAVDPKNDYYYRALGVIFHKMGDADRAYKQFSYALRLNGKSTPAYINRAEVLLTMNRYAEALQDLQNAIQFAQTREALLVRKAKALLQVIRKRLR